MEARAGRARRCSPRATRWASLPLIAEDLGRDHAAGQALRESLGLPGMAVLQFGFTPSERHTQHVPAYHEENQVVYTGTHDNDTIRAWYDALPPESLGARRRGAARVRDRGPSRTGR